MSEYDARIRSLFLSGKTYSQIGDALGITKGKVAGRCRKLGLIREGSKRVGKFAGRPAKWQNPAAPTSFMDLRLSSCRYPIGADLKDEMTYCGVQRQDGSPYCPRHHALCHQGKQGRAA